MARIFTPVHGFFLLELGITLVCFFVLVLAYVQVYSYCISVEQKACRKISATLAAVSYANILRAQHKVPSDGDVTYHNYTITVHVDHAAALRHFKHVELTVVLPYETLVLSTGIVV